MGKLDGRVALVTGAGRGFGEAIARTLAREGADVVVNYRNSAGGASRIAAELRALGRRTLVHQADVAREEDVRGLVGAALAQFGRIDVHPSGGWVMP